MSRKMFCIERAKSGVPPADRRGAQMKAPSERAPRGKYAGGVLEKQQKGVRKMVRKTEVKIIEGLRGGRGQVELHHIVSKEELNGHGSMYAMGILKPGCSIGYHQHVGNTEPYFILKGKGIFVDNDLSRTEVGPGDVCYIEVGQSHALENHSQEDLIFMALVYNE